jgi:SAM-dependent methyltransferase
MKDSSDPYSGITELADAEQGLNRYYSNIVDLIFGMNLENRKITSEMKILEFGAGTGFLAEIIQRKYKVDVDCLEIDPTLISTMKKKGLRTFESLDSLNCKYDLIYSSNVLEHIENDSLSLAQLKPYLALDGNLAIYVPAFPILFSDLDRKVGHFRRYTKSDLRNKLNANGYKICKIQFADCLGFFASVLIIVSGYKSKGNLGGIRSLKFYDRYIFPISKFLDAAGLRYLFGKNLFSVAQIEGDSYAE